MNHEASDRDHHSVPLLGWVEFIFALGKSASSLHSYQPFASLLPLIQNLEIQLQEVKRDLAAALARGRCGIAPFTIVPTTCCLLCLSLFPLHHILYVKDT